MGEAAANVSIRETREARGLTMAAAAREIGVARSTLASAERGKVPQTPRVAHLICAFCGVPLYRAAELARIEEWAPEVKSWNAEAVAA